MKRMISLCCAGLMAFSLAACGSQNAASSSTSTPQVTSAVVGKITALDGTTVTLQLGELTENQPGDPPSQDSTQPSGDNADGDNNTQGTGDSSSSTDAQTGSSTPPSGQNAPPSDGQGPAPGSTFTTGEETTTVDLSGAAITRESQSGTTDASLSDLAVGDVIEVTMGEDNTATAVVIKSVGGAPDGSGSGEVDQGTSANTIDKDGEVSGTTYTSDGDDEADRPEKIAQQLSGSEKTDSLGSRFFVSRWYLNQTGSFPPWDLPRRQPSGSGGSSDAPARRRKRRGWRRRRPSPAGI